MALMRHVVAITCRKVGLISAAGLTTTLSCAPLSDTNLALTGDTGAAPTCRSAGITGTSHDHAHACLHKCVQLVCHATTPVRWDQLADCCICRMMHIDEHMYQA